MEEIEAIQWIRDNTDLEEIKAGEFLLQEANELMNTQERVLKIL